MGFKKTSAAASALQVPYYTLMALLRYGRITPPQKDSSGDYVWTDDDLERARIALANRGRRHEATNA
jgi:DNA-binding transcriptional MerR regulator